MYFTTISPNYSCLTIYISVTIVSNHVVSQDLQLVSVEGKGKLAYLLILFLLYINAKQFWYVQPFSVGAASCVVVSSFS